MNRFIANIQRGSPARAASRTWWLGWLWPRSEPMPLYQPFMRLCRASTPQC